MIGHPYAGYCDWVDWAGGAASPVLDGCAQTQHRKPIVDAAGNTLGFTEWRAGSGLPWWPRREQRNLDLYQLALTRKVVDDFGNMLTVEVKS